MPSNDGTRIRSVIDTNLWVSYLIGRTLANLTKPLENDIISLLFSDELLDELVEVLHRPKFRKYFSLEDVRELLELINLRAEWIEVEGCTDACRDFKDNFLLDLSDAGTAEYLVTGDTDLLEMKQWGKTRIVTATQFNRILTEL